PVPQYTHEVSVGAQGDFLFNPRLVEAGVGDIVRFHFLMLNHTLTQSSLNKPCTPSNLFDTGFIHSNPQNATNNTLLFLVQNTDPQWFLCKQTKPISHCHAGMVFAINPRDNFARFLEYARQSTTTPLPSVATR
ncbi:hypothetical protein EV356DRAFT_416250, partial [Viridothelium virens]